MALTKDRGLSEKAVPHAAEFGHAVAKGFRVFRGSIVALCADNTVVPAGSTGTPSPIVGISGIARQFKDNTGKGGPLTGDAVGDHPIWIKKGCYAIPFDAQPTAASIGQPVYAVDDETVSLSNGAVPPPSSGGTAESSSSGTSSARLQVGTLSGIDLDGTPFVTIS